MNENLSKVEELVYIAKKTKQKVVYWNWIVIIRNKIFHLSQMSSKRAET
jgi:hypothetical protein